MSYFVVSLKQQQQQNQQTYPYDHDTDENPSNEFMELITKY